MAAALQIWSPTFSKAFDSLPASVRDAVQRKVDEMGARLGNFPHRRLQGRPEFKLRVGDYRVLYEFDVKQGRIFLRYVAIDVRFMSGPISLSRGNNMSLAELEKVTKAWPPISRAVRVPHTEADYRELVELLDRVTDEVGEDENHPLASLMDVLGVLIEKYEDEQVPELTE